MCIHARPCHTAHTVTTVLRKLHNVDVHSSLRARPGTHAAPLQPSKQPFHHAQRSRNSAASAAVSNLALHPHASQAPKPSVPYTASAEMSSLAPTAARLTHNPSHSPS